MVGLRADANSLGNEVSGAAQWTFANAKAAWSPTFTTPYGQSAALSGGPNAPDRITANLLSGRVGLEFKHGLELHSSAKATPYLTWPQGSVAPGVPTPKVRWLLLSWGDAEAPLLIDFGSDSLHSLQIDGEPGKWVITSDKDFTGWITFACPLGDQPFPTDTASDMGRLASEFDRVSRFWLGDQATLRGERTAEYRDGLLADWEFTAPALVPPAAVTARQNDYFLQVTSKIFRTGYSTQDGPIIFSDEPRLVVRFPMRLRAAGKPIGPAMPAVAKTSPLGQAALPLLFADGTAEQFRLAHGELESCLNALQLRQEPWTGDMLPYDGSGAGLGQAAESSLALAVFHGVETPDNSMLVSICWSMDWLTWLPTMPGAKSSDIEAAAREACLAAGLSPDPYLRAYGGMLRSALAADAPHDAPAASPTSVSVRTRSMTDQIADAIYGNAPDPRFEGLFHPTLSRISGPAIWLEAGAGGASALCWNAAEKPPIVIWMKFGAYRLPEGLPPGAARLDPQGNWIIRLDPTLIKSGRVIFH